MEAILVLVNQLDVIQIADSRSGASASILPGRGFICDSLNLMHNQKSVEILWAPENYRDRSARATSGGIPILFPYPGRLPSTDVIYQGREYKLEGKDKLGRPIHGLVHERPWRVTVQSDDRVTGEFILSQDSPEARLQWPCDFCLEATWAITGGLLHFTMKVDAYGDMPAAFGLHPYFRMPLGSGDNEQMRIDLSAHKWQPLLNLLPNGPPCFVKECSSTAIANFPGSVPLGTAEYDDVFTDLTFVNGWSTAKLIDPDAGLAVSVQCDEIFSSCVLFTPPHRKSICIEPYSCIPGHAEFPESVGWKHLHKGQSLTGRMIISLGET